MKHLASILTVVILLSNTEVAFGEPQQSQPNTPRLQATVNWHTNYETAVAQAKETHRPLLLFFTGSDWCSWCTKLDEEVLDRREFAEALNDTFVFVRLDFPARRQLPNAQQNKQLCDKHNVKSFPTILILDEQEHVIGKTGYQAGGAQRYVAHLNTLIQGRFNPPQVTNSWKVELTLAQTSLAQGQYEESLQHARTAFQKAPAKVKPDVLKAIEQIEKQMNEKGLAVQT